MDHDPTLESSYRCQVQPEQAAARLKMGSRTLPVELVEISMDGFTIRVPRKHMRKLQYDRTWTLFSRDEVTIVRPEWSNKTPQGHGQIGLARLRDETPTELRKSSRERLRSLFPRIDRRRQSLGLRTRGNDLTDHCNGRANPESETTWALRPRSKRL